MIEDAQLVRFYITLTPRQREVLQLVSLGLTNATVAARLHIRASVVAGHLTNIYAALRYVATPLPIHPPNRYLLVRLFAGFFEQHQELRAIPSTGRQMSAD